MVQFLIWAGPARPKQEGAQPGDIIEIHPDGRHFGRRVVSGQDWQGPVTNPNFVIFDVAGDRNIIKRDLVRHMTDLQDLDKSYLLKCFRIDRSSLPQAARNSLRDSGRVSGTWTQFRSVLEWKTGMSLQKLKDRLPKEDPPELRPPT